MRAQNILNDDDLGVLLRELLLRGNLLRLVHERAEHFLNHVADFLGLHVENLGDAALHDEEVRVVDVELHAAEHARDLRRLGVVAVDEVLVRSANHDLPAHANLVKRLVAHGLLARVAVVKRDGHRRLGDACLALLVHELLQIRHAHVLQRRDAQHEADGVQDVALTRAVQTGDGVELGVKVWRPRPAGVSQREERGGRQTFDDCPRRIALEADELNRLDIHSSACNAACQHRPSAPHGACRAGTAAATRRPTATARHLRASASQTKRSHTHPPARAACAACQNFFFALAGEVRKKISRRLVTLTKTFFSPP